MSRGARPAPSRSRALAGVAGALCLLGASGCFNVRWTRDLRFEELAAEEIERVEVGRSELGECLERFGAPLYVWELPHGAFSIAYGWAGDRNLGGTLRVPLSNIYSASYSYDDLAANLYGLVLVFDSSATLRVLRQGFLRDVARDLERARPADVEDAGPAASHG